MLTLQRQMPVPSPPCTYEGQPQALSSLKVGGIFVPPNRAGEGSGVEREEGSQGERHVVGQSSQPPEVSNKTRTPMTTHDLERGVPRPGLGPGVPWPAGSTCPPSVQPTPALEWVTCPTLATTPRLGNVVSK